MEIYIGTLLLIFLFAFLELRCKLTEVEHTTFFAILYVIIVMQIGLRWETGTDWNSYYNHFNDVNDISTVFLNVVIGFELGYGLLTFYIHKWFDNYSFFLLLHALVFYGVIFRVSKLLSPYAFVSLLFFYATTLGVLGSNRQLLALGICLLALPCVKERKPKSFFLLIIIGSLFHTTAILFSVYYFLNRTFKWKIIVWTLVIAAIIGKTSLPLKIFSLGGFISDTASVKVGAYSEMATDQVQDASLSIFGLFKRILFLILFTYNFRYLSNKISYYKIMYNGYAFGLLLYFLFSSTLLIIVNRGSLYFNVMESFLISSQLLILGYRKDKVYMLILIFIIAVLLMLQSISGYSDLFIPYKGVFYNVDFKRNLY